MKLKITVHGVAYEVDVEVLDAKDEMRRSASPLPPAPVESSTLPGPISPAGPTPTATPSPAPVTNSEGVASPIAGTVMEVKVKVGDQVTQGQTLLVIEAMKMETAIAAPDSGKVKAVMVAAGDAVRENQTLVEFA